MSRLRILALSGSLRSGSTNAALLDAARLLAPHNLGIERFEGIGGLPHFDPDRDASGMALPSAVAAFRASIGASHGLLIACPEYAHGLPGSFKNALDWLVSGAEFPGKPIALFHATARGAHARANLREVLVTMSGIVVDEASVTVPLLGSAATPAAIAADGPSAAAIRAGLAAFVAAIDRPKG